MWELDCEEGWAPKNWSFWTVVLEKTLESPLDCKEIQPVPSEGYQSWVFFGRNDAKAETPVLWPPHAKSWLIGKDSDAGRDWGQEEKGTTENEIAGWHHWLDGHESEWTPGVGDGQGGLACCNSWGCKESDTTEQLILSDLIWSWFHFWKYYCNFLEFLKLIWGFGLSRWLSGKESACSFRRHKRPGSWRSPGGGNGNPLQYSCLGNSIDRGAWWATVHGIKKSRTGLSNWAVAHMVLYT